MTRTRADIKSITFVIEGKPVPWKRPGQARNGHRYDTQKVIKGDVAWICKQALPANFEPFTGAVSLKVYFYFARPLTGPRSNPDKHPYHTCKPDKDNLEKIIKDSVNGIAWVDDAQVDRGSSRKLYALERNEARTVVMISEIPKRKGK